MSYAGSGSQQPRRVRWRRGILLGMLVGGFICALIAAGIIWYAMGQGKRSIVLQQQNSLTAAVITSRWSSQEAGATHYWIAYRYPQLPSDEPELKLEVSQVVWEAMTPGTKWFTRYSPADPAVNGLSGQRSHLFRKWLLTGGVLSLAAVIALVAISVVQWRRRHSAFWLVKHGRSVVGEILDTTETMFQRGDRRTWHYDVEYRFTVPDGGVVSGRHREVCSERKYWQLGAAVTVFFDPKNPKRYALYSALPGEVVSR